MFGAVFGNDMWFLAELTVVATIVGLSAWAVTHRYQIPYSFWWLPLTFSLTGVIGVTLALRGGEAGRAECVINHEITEPLYTTQGLWNLAMFVPLGLFGVLALRRPLPLLAGVLVLPCLIEVTQALAPFVSGICDSADVEMNAGGGLLGVALGLVAVWGRVAWKAWAKPTLIVTAALGVTGMVVCQTAITLNHVDGSGVREAHGAERDAAERAIHQAFGNYYNIGNVRVRPGIDGSNGWISIQMAGAYPAELMWPGGRQLNVSFENSTAPSKASFPVPGAERPRDARGAYLIAQAYMKAHYPWAETASWHETRSVGSKAEFGWLTSWRFKEHGVVMPRSLDVQINRAGRVSQMLVDFGPSHVDLPAHLISAKQAEQIVGERRKKDGADSGALRIRADVLKVEQVQGQGPWRVVWLVKITDTTCKPEKDGSGCEPYTTAVDAGAGKIYDE
ncbi:VanZ family protein [Streptomyces sp900105245]|uniref:VanZ family protein n=1 Tax=Streptomyces sp. 900105245 TaxID=3154379 RepID=UPI00331A8872